VPKPFRWDLLRITDVQITPVRIPFKEPIRLSFAEETSFASAIIQVQTDEGIVGIGETCHTAQVDPILPMLKRIAELAVGEDPTDLERLSKMYLGSGGAGIWWVEVAVKAIAGLEMACWDIIGKKLGVPVYRMLGGRYREKVPVTAFLGIKRPKEVADDAIKAVEQGYRTLKLKVGRDLAEDVGIVKSVRDAVGEGVEIRVDPNQAWSPGTAVRQIRKISRYDPQYIEQPVPRYDIEGLKRVRDSVDVPIAVCEGVFSIFRAMDFVRRGAADIISSDPTRMGGLLEFKKLCGLAEAADIPVVMHVSWGAITQSAWLQICTSTPNIMYANDFLPANGVGRVNADEVTTTKFNHERGYVQCPEGPGLGLEVDPSKLNRYADLYKRTGPTKPGFFAYPPIH